MEIDTQTTKAGDGSVIHYEARGKPSPEHPSLVFLHYYGGSPSTWATLLDQPPFAGFHTVCYHARGWAPSTGPPDPGAYGIEAMSSDLSAVLSATGLRDGRAGFVLVGHSMGAKVAQHYAATAESAESVRFVLDNVLTAAPGALAEDAVAACVGDSLRGNEWAKVAWPEYALGQGFGDLVDRIQAPVLVLRGDKDFEKDMVGLLGTDSGWINKDIENCGHLVPLEQPVQLGKEILAFVRKIS
ncbi:hypothetical protein GTA08_BOTSDO08059 [Neofusicoccum parvum]|uniref:Uncharacterized protein n=1 Tax=Neofusicoccum parvum TaxID=310453 RepID=A0ACB5RVU1_9PEZI|nr:hypothetical protein GTA08_BOTSDO08059 [Neofusicoccum parvum]